MMALKGKRILIIGGSSGIGLGCAQLCVDKGADVHIASRSKQNLQQAKDKLVSPVSTWVVDFTQESQVKNLFSNVGGIDHLLTPAVSFETGGLLDQPLIKARATLESKFWGQYISARYGAPSINEGGSIIFFSGVAGIKPFPGFSMVAAACGAIDALGMQLAAELAPIRVNTISPGFIDTPIHEHMAPADQLENTFAEITDTLLIKRIGSPEEVAHAAVYLMENGYTTGETLVIDGGLRYS